MTHATITPTPVLDLHLRWQTFLRTHGALRIRDAADRLGVSELELRATEIGRDDVDAHVTRLAGDWSQLIARLPDLGEVMALTRNDAVVHEKVGTYGEIRFEDGFGLVLNRDIDLRLFMSQWAHGVAVVEPSRAGATHRSLQFFDRSGTAIHKIYLRETSCAGAYAALVDRFCSEDQRPGVTVVAPAQRAEPKPDAEIDVTALRTDWLALTDTHDFYPMLHRHGVARTQALRLAPKGHTERMANLAITEVLRRAAETQTSIMVFVSSPGCVQIHTGPVERVVPMGPWINVLDPGFNLHLRTDAIADTWIVRKPTDDGIISSLEMFDDRGRTIAMLFGERAPDQPESPRWRERLAELPRRPGLRCNCSHHG